MKSNQKVHKEFKNAEKIVSIAFLLVGIIALAIGSYFLFSRFIIDNNKQFVDATIVNIFKVGDDSHRVIIQYNVDGIPYQSSINYYSSSYEVGKHLKAYYYLENIERIYVRDVDLFSTIFPMSFGLIFFVIASILLINRFNKNKLKDDLINNGSSILALFSKVSINRNYSINDQNPFVIECEYYDSFNNKTYIFKSENIWFNPTEIIEQYNIKCFKVYYKENNFKKYYVDIEDVMIKSKW